MKKNLNILICPLEWGLGHAGRMIPLARKLSAKGHNVIIGSGEELLSFFKNEMPDLKYITFKGFRIRYSLKLPQYLVIMLNIPALVCQSMLEHYRLKKIIKIHSVDIVISDSRIGLWNRQIRSVLVLHFPRIPLPSGLRFLEGTVVKLSRLVMKRFSYCFIPDLEGAGNLTGRLSHELVLPDNSRFIGILSRFSQYSGQLFPAGGKYRFMVILSGPEPQKGLLRQKLSEILSMQNGSTIILGADPSSGNKYSAEGKITYVSHLPEKQMAELMLGSELIITRSGYTTIMELASINRSAIIIPTPGQTEQEYLAGYLSGKSWFRAFQQSELNSITELTVPEPAWPANINGQSESLLEKALKELLEE